MSYNKIVIIFVHTPRNRFLLWNCLKGSTIRREKAQIVGWINFTIPGNLLGWNWKSASDPFISLPPSLTPFNIIIVTLFLLTSVHIAHFRFGILNIAFVILYVFWIEIPGVSFDRFHSLRHFLSNLAQPLFGTTSLDTQWNRVFVWSKFCICITYFLHFL